MSTPVERWLETFMCKQYADLFEAWGYKTLQSVCQLDGHRLRSMGVRPEHFDKIMENVSVLQQSYRAKGGPPAPPPNPPPSQFVPEEGFCPSDPSIDPVVNPASSALISMSRNAMQRGRYRSGGSEDMGSSPGSSLGAPCPNSPMPPTMASPHSRLMSPPMASPHMAPSSLRSPAPSPAANMMQQQPPNMGANGPPNPYQGPGPGPGAHFMGQQQQPPTALGYYNNNSAMYPQQQQLQQRVPFAMQQYWGSEQYGSYGNNAMHQQQPPQQPQTAPTPQMQQQQQPQQQPQTAPTPQMQQQQQTQQMFPYNNNGMSNGYIMGSALPPQLRNPQLQQPRENPQFVADSILQMASQQCLSNTPAVGPKLAPGAYNPQLPQQQQQQQHFEFSPPSPAGYCPASASSPATSCSSSPASLRSPPQHSSMPSPRAYPPPAAPLQSPFTSSFSYPSSSSLSSTSCVAPSNPLMSLQKLVMRPESQVVDPKSVVSDAACGADIPPLEDALKNFAPAIPAHEASPPIEALQPSQPTCPALAEQDGPDKKRKHQTEDVSVAAKKCRKDPSPCKDTDNCEQTKNALGDTMTASGPNPLPPAPHLPDAAVVVSPETPLPKTAALSPPPPPTPSPLPPPSPLLKPCPSQADTSSSSKKKKVKLKELKKRKHLGLELSKKELKRLKKEKKKNKKRKKLLKNQAAAASAAATSAATEPEELKVTVLEDVLLSPAENPLGSEGEEECPLEESEESADEQNSKEEEALREDQEGGDSNGLPPELVAEETPRGESPTREVEKEEATSPVDSVKENCAEVTSAVKRPHRKVLNDSHMNCTEGMMSLKQCLRDTMAKDSNQNIDLKLIKQKDGEGIKQLKQAKIMADEELDAERKQLLGLHATQLQTDCVVFPAARMGVPNHCHTVRRKDDLKQPLSPEKKRASDEVVLENGASEDDFQVVIAISSDEDQSSQAGERVIPMRLFKASPSHTVSEVDNPMKRSAAHQPSPPQKKPSPSPKRLGRPKGSKNKPSSGGKAASGKGKKRRRKDFSMDDAFSDDDNIKDPRLKKTISDLKNARKKGRKDIGRAAASSATCSSSASGPYIKLRGPKSQPDSCEVVNTDDDPNGGRARRKKKTVDVTMLSSVKFDVSVPWTCVFCARSTSDALLGDLYGPYHPEPSSPRSPTRTFSPDRDKPAKVRRNSLGSSRDHPMKRLVPPEIWLHEDCAVWTGGVHFSHGRLLGLDDAISAAKQTTCCACKMNGASLGCLRKGCVLKYHFACAVEKDCQLDEDNFSMVCPKHKRLAWNKKLQSSESENPASFNSVL